MTAAELRARVETVLRHEVAPALLMDGEGLEVLDVSDGVAQVRLSGACASCPASIMTLVSTLEAELRARVPEVEVIEAVS